VTLEGSRVTAARLAFGGMAAVPARARKAEAALLNQEWHERTIASAIDALTEDFQPLTDLRASSEYRMLTAGHLLRRFYRESLGKSGRSLRNLTPVTELS
jgi:xanthine dehydrogenase small subunit